MPKKCGSVGERRDFVVCLRFQNRYKSVIQQIAKESGKNPSAWVRSIIWQHIKDRTDLPELPDND